MKPQRHRDTEIRQDRIRLFFFSTVSLCVCVSVAFVLLSSHAQQKTATPPPLEGCLKCHDKIEPMHRFGPTDTLDKLDNAKDALGLTCPACHRGNPVATTKDEANVRPSFPNEWLRE